jgi:hypothetical protein
VCDGAFLGSDSILFDRYLFSQPVVAAVEKCSVLSASIQCSKTMNFKGTDYVRDMYVVLHVVEAQPVFGKILLCVLDSTGSCGLVVSAVTCQRSPMLGMFSVVKTEVSNYKCLLVNDLWDYHPLPGYVINGSTHIALKHALLDSC